MARLLITMEGFGNRPLELRPGVNRLGRNPDCDFQINHATVSALHCELILSIEGVLLRDCDSTNGTFVEGEPVKEVSLRAAQKVQLGDVTLLVESTEIIIAIPELHRPGNKFPLAGVGSPVVMPDGALVCPRHSQMLVTYKCKQCCEPMCGKCVRTIKRKGGLALFLCPLCSGPCERINAGPGKKKTFMQAVRDTVKLPFSAFSGRSASAK